MLEGATSNRGQSDLYNCQPSDSSSLQQPQKPSLLNSRLAEERARILSEARDLLGGSADPDTLDLFQAFLREREQRLGAVTPALTPVPAAFSGSVSRSQLISPGVSVSDHMNRERGTPQERILSPGVTVSDHINRDRGTPQPQERIIPITITRSSETSDISEPPVISESQGTGQVQVRIIPVMVETDSGSSSAASSATESQDSSPSEEADTVKLPPSLPSLLAEMKVADSLLKPQGRTGFHHPSFANHFGLSRLRNPEEKSGFFSGSGIRDSFPGFPNFGNFPSFTPLLTGDRPFPDRSHFRDKSKADAIHKQRLAKSKSSVDYSADKQPESFR